VIGRIFLSDSFSHENETSRLDLKSFKMERLGLASVLRDERLLDIPRHTAPRLGSITRSSLSERARKS